MADAYDVVVVGGGAAGLGGALMLARSRRTVLVVDSGEPRNAPADGVHGFLTRDGMPPAELLAVAREEVRGYGGQIVAGRVVHVAGGVDDGFVVSLDGGRTVGARRLLVATGLVDELPAIPGVAERWGRDVLHCPYCHGWEVQDLPIAVLASGGRAVHQALLFRQLSADVTFLRHREALTPEQEEQLAALDIPVVEGEVESLEVTDDRLTGVRLRGARVVPCRAVVVGPRMRARAEPLLSLGLEAAEHPSGMGTYLPSEASGLTAVPGVWVAGNVADPSAQVLKSAAAGAVAAAAINADLVEEDGRRAVVARRDRLAGVQAG